MTHPNIPGNSEPREDNRFLPAAPTDTESAGSKEGLARDLRRIGRDLDELIEHSKTLTQSEFEVARRNFIEGVAQAKRQSQRIGARVSEAGARTDDYIRGHPWQAAGTALGVGVLVGMLISRR
jgi:ElaB/YqjD/DUF883 family membrane-anchored ribosome-binding protein